MSITISVVQWLCVQNFGSQGGESQNDDEVALSLSLSIECSLWLHHWLGRGNAADAVSLTSTLVLISPTSEG